MSQQSLDHDNREGGGGGKGRAFRQEGIVITVLRSSAVIVRRAVLRATFCLSGDRLRIMLPTHFDNLVVFANFNVKSSLDSAGSSMVFTQLRPLVG